VAEVQDLLLDAVDGGRVEADGREPGPSVLLLDAEHQVAAAEVVEVVGEGAQGVEHVERVPAPLELQALPTDGAAVEEGVDVEGEGHG